MVDGTGTWERTPYRLLSKIGEGEMGEVFAAEHAALKKPVVVKILREHYAKNPKTADRARLEAQAVAALRHPNIVEAFDFGRTDDGSLYLVMEHLSGQTLASKLAGTDGLEPLEAIKIIRQVLRGLAEAHRVGIIHRDVKPGNLFLCDDGTIKILDFGLAKVLGSAGSEAPSPLLVPTEEGMMMGSPRYLSPEQARGAASADARTDVYGAGAVFYFLLTGRDPFHHVKGLYEILMAHLGEKPLPPSRLARRELPAALDSIVLRALAKDPDDRWLSAKAFDRALERIEVNPPCREAPRRAARWERTEPLSTQSLAALLERVAPRDEQATMPLVAPAKAAPVTPIVARKSAPMAAGMGLAPAPVAVLVPRKHRSAPHHARPWYTNLLIVLAVAAIVASSALVLISRYR